MKSVIGKILKVGVPFAIGASIMWWMYRDIELDALWQLVFNDIHWGWMVLSLLMGVLPSVFRGVRWKMALKPIGENTRSGVCIDACFLSYAASLLIPRIGELTRCGTLKTYDGVSFSKALGTVVTERIVDSIILLVISFVSFCLGIPKILGFLRAAGVEPYAVLQEFSTAGYIVTFVCILLLILVVIHTMWKLRVFSNGPQFVNNIWQGVASLRKVKNKFSYLLLSIGIWAGYFLHFYIAFWAFDATSEISVLTGLLIFCVCSFAVIVPTPNGAGPWHFAVKTMLVLCGAKEQPAVLFALAVHTIQTSLVVLLGVWSSIRLALIHKMK